MSRLPLHPYDLLMLAVLVGVTIFGFLKGMAWQLAALASLVLSFFAAVHFSPMVAPFFSTEAPWNRFLAMATIYLLVWLAIGLLFRVVARVIDRVKLQEFDRQAGAIFGLLKGVVFCIVLTFFTVTLSQPAREAVLQSRSGYYIAIFIRHATPILPQDLRDALGKYIDRLNQNLPDPTRPRPAPTPTAPTTPAGAKAAAPAAPGRAPATTNPAGPTSSPTPPRVAPKVTL
jgi:membrane protein required for colicin V production